MLPSARRLAALVVVLGCEGSHTDLGVEPTTTSTSSGAGASGAGAGDGLGGSGGGVAEPDGTPKLTVVHGVVDQPAIAFCFLASPADVGDVAEPWPDPPLAFAEPRAIAPTGDPVPAAIDVEVVILAGDVGPAMGERCRDLVDDPLLVPSVIVQSLGVLPADALAMGRSLLLAPIGCLSPGHEEDATPQVCGEAYLPDLPTPGVVVAPMSRVTKPGRVGIQIVHASSGLLEPIDVGILPGLAGEPERTVGEEVGFGEAAPFPPGTAFDALDLPGVGAGTLRTYLPAVTTPVAETPVADAFANGGVVPEDFTNGTNVVFLAIGPAPGIEAGPWWSGFTYVALRSDP